MKSKYKFFAYILVFSLIFPIVTKINVFAQKKEKNVLVLKSYNDGDQWEDDMQDIISATFSKYNENININFENMDSRQINSPKFFEYLKKFLKSKYNNHKFDAIITCDNDAFNFACQNHEELFKNVPVVFCGVNNYEDEMIKDKPYITGVAEVVDIKGTLDKSLKIFKKITTVGVVTDNTVTGVINKELIKKIEGNYKNIKFVYINYDKMMDVRREIIKLPRKNTMVFIEGAFMNQSGEYINLSKAAQILSNENNIPFVSCWDFYLNHGIVGGNITESKFQGIKAVELTMRVLNGESPNTIPVINELHSNYVYDYNLLKKFNIDVEPSDCTIINKPKNNYNIPKTIVWVGVYATICFLTFAIIVLLISNMKRKNAEENSKSREKQLRLLIDTTPDLICFKDGEGRIIEANKAIIDFFAIDTSLGESSFKGKSGEDVPLLIEGNRKILCDMEKNDKIAWSSGKIYRNEECIKDASGKSHYFDAIRVPLYYENGNHKGILLMKRDITENKINSRNKELLRETMEYDRIKTEFFANISHELRTPINVMFSTIQLMDLYLKKGYIIDNGGELKKKNHSLKQNCFRLLRLINNLIDITKIDAGFFKLHLRNDDIVSIVEDITLSVAEYIENKGINLIFDTDVEERNIVFDADKIERIMLNLLSNAVKFTEPRGKILVNLIDGNDFISISVKDTGIGIPLDKQEMIFERFRQVDKTLARNKEGSGIGLSLVKSLVELHMGTVEVNSMPGFGSEFIIKIPVGLKAENNIEPREIKSQEKVEKIKIEFSDIYN